MQSKIFQRIAEQIKDKPLVPYLCSLLHLSKSAVYERVSGKKSLSLTELKILSDAFSLNWDDLVEHQPGKVSFFAHSMRHPIVNGEMYLKNLAENVFSFARIPSLQVWFTSPSLPFFHHMHFRELALFKLFAYSRINWQLAYTEYLKFHPDTFPEKRVYEDYMQPIISTYSQLPTIEFFSDDLYCHTLHQIRYFSELGQIPDNTVVSVLYEQLAALCYHHQEMASKGRKWVFHSNKHRSELGGHLDLYYNQIATTTISLLLDSPKAKGVYTVLDDPNFMFSDDSHLFDYTLHWLNKLQAKCLKISEGGEKERRIYFNRISTQIATAAMPQIIE